MGLRCLLGHNFGEPELERERKEDGNEVVITVREVKTCQRCGEQQIVSENKEVTSIEQLADEAEAAEAEAASTSDDSAPFQHREPGGKPPVEEAEPGSGVDSTTGVDPTTDVEPVDEDGGVELLDEGPAETDASDPGPDLSGIEGEGEPSMGDRPTESAEPGTEPGTEPSAESGGEPGASAEEEDVEILPGSDSGTEPGMEPGSDSNTGATSAAGGTDEWPEVGRERSADAETEAEKPVEDDGVILNEAGEETSERDYGEWPAVEEKTDESDREGGDISPWPEHHGEDEGYDATVDETDDEEEDVGVSFGGGLTPEADGEQTVEDDAEFIESGPSDPAPGEGSTAGDAPTDEPTSRDGTAGGSASGDAPVERPGSEDVPTENIRTADGAAETDPSNRSSGAASGSSNTARDFSATEGAELTTSMNEADMEYYCPECGMTQDSDGGSMRAGDICPECKRGYVTERPL